MADRAGLGMRQDELDALKPIYELYAAYARELHTLSFGSEEWWWSSTPTGRKHDSGLNKVLTLPLQPVVLATTRRSRYDPSFPRRREPRQVRSYGNR